MTDGLTMKESCSECRLTAELFTDTVHWWGWRRNRSSSRRLTRAGASKS